MLCTPCGVTCAGENASVRFQLCREKRIMVSVYSSQPKCLRESSGEEPTLAAWADEEAGLPSFLDLSSFPTQHLTSLCLCNTILLVIGTREIRVKPTM